MYLILFKDIINLASESGLSAVFLGFESIDILNLKSICQIKKNWREKYEKTIIKLHEKKVLIMGSFIFGFDGGDNGKILKTVEWAIKNKLDLVQFSILTPLPGTSLFKELDKQKRIETYAWTRYNTFESVFKATGWQEGELKKKIKKAYKKFYSYSSILKRINKLPALHLLAYLMANVEFKFLR